MEKNTYRNMMDRIKMSSSCEQEILRKAAEQPEQNEIIMKTKKKRSPVLAAVAACLCVALVGTVTASAIQDKGWLVDMFTDFGYISDEVRNDTEYQEELYGAAEEYFSEISNFEATGKYADSVTPVGAVCDSRGLYVAVSYMPDVDESEGEYFTGVTQFTGNPGIGIALYNGNTEIPLNGAHSGQETQADGSHLVWIMFRPENPFTSDTVRVEMPIVENIQYLEDNKVVSDSEELVCSLSFDVDLSKKAKTVSYKVDEILRHEVEVLGIAKCFYIEEIELSALYMTLKGDQGSNEYYFDDPFYVITKDGEEIGCNIVSGIHFGTDVEEDFSFEKPVDPASVVAIKAGDKVIELN